MARHPRAHKQGTHAIANRGDDHHWSPDPATVNTCHRPLQFLHRGDDDLSRRHPHGLPLAIPDACQLPRQMACLESRGAPTGFHPPMTIIRTQLDVAWLSP